jgi:transcriptional regulator with XRE-family HTH domain
MEEQLRINWPAVVEAAKQKRKKLKLTQQRLAELAGVSTPTVSHFESGQKDLQLSTITRILGVLGMLDERVLIFPDPKPRYDPGRMSVSFDGRDGEKTVRCAISEEALRDHFGDDDDARRTFLNNQERIEAEARRKYLAGDIKSDGSVLIVSMDLYR